MGWPIKWSRFLEEKLMQSAYFFIWMGSEETQSYLRNTTQSPIQLTVILVLGTVGWEFEG